jgi:hypothetical protein
MRITFVWPSVFVLSYNPAVSLVGSTEIAVNPGGVCGGLAASVAQLDPDRCSVGTGEIGDALKWCDLAVSPQSLDSSCSEEISQPAHV